MTKSNLPECQEDTLCRVIHRSVRGLLNFMEGLKVLPHRVRGIGQMAVRERVRHKQITELVVNRGHWDWETREQQNSNQE
jgi:hypothetical protein